MSQPRIRGWHLDAKAGYLYGYRARARDRPFDYFHTPHRLRKPLRVLFWGVFANGEACFRVFGFLEMAVEAENCTAMQENKR